MIDECSKQAPIMITIYNTCYDTYNANNTNNSDTHNNNTNNDNNEDNDNNNHHNDSIIESHISIIIACYNDDMIDERSKQAPIQREAARMREGTMIRINITRGSLVLQIELSKTVGFQSFIVFVWAETLAH